MHNVVIDKPYVFVPPYHGRIWPRLLQRVVPWYLKKSFGVTEVNVHGLDHLRHSLASGHGILLAPNHCRPADPFVVSEVARQASCTPFVMASWHLFMQNRFQAWLLRRGGVFSVYREGMDRAAVSAAIEILEQAARPLVIFPEGVISRANDRLNPLMEGTSFIARSAAKKRAKATPAGQVVIHPLAMKFHFRGNLEAALGPVLEDIEHRLSWRSQSHLPLVERIYKVGEALLSLKEMEYLGHTHEGEIPDRLSRLIDCILMPLEQEWLPGQREASVVARVKKLRTAVLPDMVKGEITDDERERRWKQLADMYLAQQLSCYPAEYIRMRRSPERILETVERFEEDLTDVCRVHRPMAVTVQVGPAILVAPERDRSATSDPVLVEIESQLTQMLAALDTSTEIQAPR